MCKPSCCPGTTTSSGLSTAAAIAAVVVVTAMATGPIATAAAHLLHALITIAIITVAALAALAATVLIIRRTRRAPEHRAPITIAASTQRPRPSVRVAPAALHAPPTAGFCLTPGERARCQALRADPDQVAQIITAVLGGPQ
jgi:hypothetical protein